MAKQQIKPQRYQVGTTVNGYAVYDASGKTPTTPVYFAHYRPLRDDNVDIETAFLKIAGFLNIAESQWSDKQLIDSINKQLEEFAQYKVQ